MKEQLRILFIMKWILLFLIAGVLQCGAASNQNLKITLKMENKTVQEILSEIESKSGVYFTYNPEQINVARKTSIKVDNQPVEEVLNRLFAGENVKYSVNDKHIVIYRESKGASTNSQQQSGGVRVTGKVTDNFNAEIPGALISVRGHSTLGTTTDANGEFSITVPGDTCVLRVSFIGYKTEEITIGKSRIFSITLKEAETMLDEVTIVAFGKQKKESVVASIATINTKDLKVPSSNMSTALAGRIAGMVSYQTSGEPGQDDASFFVRGVTSLTYASGPLILIDGVEMTSSDLSRMQPDDIASFSIMKDATATALYGARGANGVILITTKEGREGATTVSFRTETSVSMPTYKVKFADPITYMRLNNEAVLTRDPRGNVPYSQEKIDNTMDPNRNQYVYPANDWYDMLMEDQTFNYRANLNVSGGGKVARYYVAATLNQDNGNLKVDRQNNFNNNIDLKKYLLRSNVNINLTKTTEAIVRLSGTFDDYQGPLDGGDALYKKIVRSDPVMFAPKYAPDKVTAYTHHILFGNAETANYINPYADMVKGYKDYNKSQMMAQFELKQNFDFITPGLAARALYSTNRYSFHSVKRQYKPYYYSIAAYDRPTDTYILQWLNNGTGQAEEWLRFSEDPREIKTTNYTEAAVIYDRTFADKHAVSGLLVFTMRNYSEANASNFELSLPHRNMGVSGRATYAYDSRYFSEFNFGYNGSERFAKNERFGFFPSIGFGWVVSNERFWAEKLRLDRIMPKLKFKGTYGLVGNDAIGEADDRFFYLSRVLMGTDSGRSFSYGYDFNQTHYGVAVERYANDMITWETARKMNLGLEMNLFGKLDFIFDYYTEKRAGILLDRSYVPATMGLNATPQANLGKAKGSGIDFSVDYQHYFNKDLWVTGRMNFTYATTKYTEYEEIDYSATPWRSRIGQPVSQQFGYVAERLFVDDYEVRNSPSQNFNDNRGIMGGDIKYKDIDGDGQITDLDKVPIGFPTEPQIIYGFGLSAGYKGLDFSFFFQGLGQRSFWINTATQANTGSQPSTYPFVDTDADGNIRSKNALLQVYADNHWSEDNRNLYALWPRLSDQIVNNNTQTSTWFMRNGSFLRLKSAELGYTAPERVTNKIKMKTFRVYISGTNLLTFSQFKLWDPEMAGNGLGYPLQKVYNLGLQFTF
ncbi:SusC/RagA family TonB-linked outer membrane protein [Bacteroidia bacterium]|nr:SusC/RagA family TonB-linked outer membrane protein [Bacteroidia bacterium]GHV30810.1 SusC/RagA family TonB-linked outer membrane protein [Bacteroidia bacterium]